MKTKRILAALLSVAFLSVSAADKNPVVMKINGKDVRLSEFEYLYRKNKQQQIEDQPFDKYVDMFVTYKLKVADAEAEGIDTTQSFINEYKMYRNDLFQSYIDDKSVLEKLAKEQYDRMKEDVDVYHLMFPLEDGVTTTREMQIAKIDSIRTILVNGGNFEEYAKKYSVDPSVKSNNGHIGWVRSGMYPYQFEVAAWNTPIGEYSPVFATDYGYHVVKVGARRKSKGEVLTEHILILTPRDRNEKGITAAKAKIDSIYDLVKKGEDFETLAKRFSEDPGSNKDGGRLPWFGTRQMVPEFEEAAFSTPVDSVSKPFATAYGFHIVKKLDERSLFPYEKVKDNILASFKNDNRQNAGKEARLAQIKTESGFKFLEGRDEIFKTVKECGGFDSVCIARLEKSNTPLMTFAGKTIGVNEFMPRVKSMKGLSVIGSQRYLEDNLDNFAKDLLTDYEMNRMMNENPDFSNLANEYRDGLLLFAVSDQKVWKRSNNDVAGLEAYFEAHKDKYKWSAPRFKGYLIQVSNDSVAALVKAELTNLGGDTLASHLRKEFSGNLRIDKVIIPQGKNSLIDVCVFGADKSKAKTDERYPVYFVHDWKVIDAPEVAADDKGAVVVDYQNQLESDWVNEIKAKYPVKINKKALKKVK